MPRTLPTPPTKGTKYLSEQELVHRGLYELGAIFLAIGYWDQEKRGFIGIAHQIQPPALTLEYSAQQLRGTARAKRAVDRVLPLGTELEVVLENRCSDCHEELFMTEIGWAHEDATAVCGSSVSLRNSSLEHRLRNAELRIERNKS